MVLDVALNLKAKNKNNFFLPFKQPILENTNILLFIYLQIKKSRKFFDRDYFKICYFSQLRFSFKSVIILNYYPRLFFYDVN